MTTAEIVLAAIADAKAVTLYGGYCVNYNGSRHTFEPAKIRNERRNERGRVTYLEAYYQDGSRLIFYYSENRGGRYKIG